VAPSFVVVVAGDWHNDGWHWCSGSGGGIFVTTTFATAVGIVDGIIDTRRHASTLHCQQSMIIQYSYLKTKMIFTDLVPIFLTQPSTSIAYLGFI